MDKHDIPDVTVAPNKVSRSIVINILPTSVGAWQAIALAVFCISCAWAITSLASCQQHCIEAEHRGTK